jgi:hypothetical protein
MADSQTNRNEFFTVKVGSRYHGGYEPVKSEVVIDNRKPSMYHSERTRQGGKIISTTRSYCWSHRRSAYNQARMDRDRRKGTAATYLSPPPRKETQVIEKLTGQYVPVLVDSIWEAKKFKRQSQAKSACEKLESYYSAAGVVVKIERGDHNERPSNAKRQDHGTSQGA